MRPDCLVSIHDVMPATLDGVTAIVDRLEKAELSPATLLVVPGVDWSDAEIERLRELARRGHRLAGHGWRHRATSIRGVYHRLHALLISRQVAEHLALDRDGIRRLIRDCHAWFLDHGLPDPQLYVPPAWAMGDVSPADLDDLGFRWFETLAGYYDTDSGRTVRVPLLGFEADTRLRAVALRAFNALNRLLARRSGRLRVAIHPHDFELRLADDLSNWLESGALPETLEALARS